ncbi:YkvI family membrane protein [Paenibacillus senegalensis]|uniref:YkvI family membrane protein n=1 Tax=Paenibacillus senegalensis TaxID=1465766 RepID=UPI000287A80F|nr:membrane protein [Paenibacillus senegalensis]
MKPNPVKIIQVAATYIGTVVGAGFASGQGILQFFTGYGAVGIIGIWMCTLLFIWLGSKMMLLAHRIKAYSYRELNTYLFGQFFGRVANGFTLIVLLGSSAVMLAGTGSIVEEQLGYPYQWGIIATVVLSFVVIRRGMAGILLVNSLVMPAMLIFLLIVAGSLISAGDFTPGPAAMYTTAGNGWLLSAFSYAALNMALVQAVLVPLGSEINDEKVLRWGGLWGGIGVGIMLMIVHFALLAKMPLISQYAIPMGEVIRNFGPWIHILFLIVIYGEIFTTLVGNVFGLIRQLSNTNTFRRLQPIPGNWLVLFILLLCLIISQFGFSSLMVHLYTYFGYLGLILLVLLVFRRYPGH